MEKKILIGLDGSAFAEAGLPLAELFARAGHTTVVLVEVIRIDELPTEPPEEPVPDDAPLTERFLGRFSNDLTQEQRTQSDAEHYLQAIVEQMGKSGVVAEAIVAVGEPATVLVEEARLRDAGLIIISTHGRSGLGRWIYGSVADAVMRQASVPVLLVPPYGRRDWPHDRPPRILVPLDGSMVATEALAPARRLATSLGSEVLLVQVIEPLAYSYATSPDMAAYMIRDLDAEAAAASAYLADVAGGLRAGGLMVQERVLNGPVAPTIASIVQKDHIDLIVLASHGSGGLTRLLLGSVATGVIQRASVPLLVVRPAAICCSGPK